jgi:serine/threonine protein kinase
MKGGELIATGSSSCVLTPNIPCKKNGRISKDRVSKIIYSEDAIDESIDEKRMNGKIKQIKGHSSWAVIFDESCKPFKKEMLSEYDEVGISDCLDEEEDYALVKEFDNNSYMMNGEYGGITLDGYFEQVFNKKIKKSTSFNNEFYDLMVRMEPLFLGLKKMNENNIVHNDIKPNNIVLHKGKFKYIDFGLSSMKSNKNHFKQRSLYELNTDRIYLYYPIEYLLYYASKNKLNEEISNIYKGKYRRNYENFIKVSMLFGSYGIDVYDSVTRGLKNNEIKETKMIQSIDVYSLGILVPVLFLFHTQLWNEKNPSEKFSKDVANGNELVNDFFFLFGQMVNSSSNQRITAKDALIKFKILLNKHRPKKKKSKQVRKVSRKKDRKTTKKKKSKQVRKVSRKKDRKTTEREKKSIVRRNRVPFIERVNMRREAY